LFPSAARKDLDSHLVLLYDFLDFAADFFVIVAACDKDKRGHKVAEDRLKSP
jgi:hypothetical protein